jgi:hypothetical protein
VQVYETSVYWWIREIGFHKTKSADKRESKTKTQTNTRIQPWISQPPSSWALGLPVSLTQKEIGRGPPLICIHHALTTNILQSRLLRTSLWLWVWMIKYSFSELQEKSRWREEFLSLQK